VKLSWATHENEGENEGGLAGHQGPRSRWGKEPGGEAVGLSPGGCCAKGRKEREQAGLVATSSQKERRERRKKKTFFFYIFTNLLQIQTNFKFKATQL
jgi:hypothetical protein